MGSRVAAADKETIGCSRELATSHAERDRRENWDACLASFGFYIFFLRSSLPALVSVFGHFRIFNRGDHTYFRFRNPYLSFRRFGTEPLGKIRVGGKHEKQKETTRDSL